jgi:hypothetical protein
MNKVQGLKQDQSETSEAKQQQTKKRKQLSNNKKIYEQEILKSS